MTINTLARFCQAMKDIGVEPVSTPLLGYRYDVIESGHAFSLLIHEPDEAFLQAPKVTILSKPKIEGVKQTHVVEGNTLCYVDDNAYYLDAEHPEKAASDIVGFINLTIKRMVSPELSLEDFNNEFDAYWRPDRYAYLIGNEQARYIAQYKRRSAVTQSETSETLLHEGEDSVTFKAWSHKRGYTQNDQGTTENVITLTLKDAPIQANADKPLSWPILSWQAFLVWSQSQGSSFVALLLEKVAKVALRTHDITILMNYHNNSGLTHHFAVRVIFKRDIRAIAKRDQRARELTKKSRQQGRKLKDIVAMFSAQQATSFERIGILNASPGFVIGRNTLNKDLAGLKIALVGCGTLGGYIASTLTKLGAGTGEGGELILSDGDWLKPENIGRHVLDAQYLGEPKSSALKHFTQNSVYWPLKCELWPPLDEAYCRRLLAHCDIIIDAVGNIPLSKMLSSDYHRSTLSQGTMLLHGWVDADGEAVRCLLDDNTAGCIQCLRVEGKERFPVFKHNNDNVTHNQLAMSCGQSFTPYATNVSLAGASLIVNTLLDNMNDKNAPRLRQYKVGTGVQSLKWQNPKPLNHCSVCRR